MRLLSLRSRRGSYIAEAAVVLPVIILTVITVVLIIMFFYDESVNQSKMHIALRCETGQVTKKTTSYINESGITDSGTVWDGNLTIDRNGIFRKVSGDKSIYIIARGILKSRAANTISDSAYVIDAVRFVRVHGSIWR